MPLHQAYARAMRTWANWVEKTVDPKKTTVFFRSISAEHISLFYNQWCYDRTQPMFDVESYKPPTPKILTKVIERVIKGMKKIKVTYLNITRLSEYRIDAHPSIYRVKEWKLYSQINKHNLTLWADCGHWCLPGVPDTWNRLLYASLYFNTSTNR
ncbi:Protein trichome birefringence-like 1 [Bienertia sinuspersici]